MADAPCRNPRDVLDGDAFQRRLAFADQRPISFPTTPINSTMEAWQMSALIKLEAAPKCDGFEVRFPDGRPSRHFGLLGDGKQPLRFEGSQMRPTLVRQRS
jgi:hypothetical protein